MAIGKSEKVQTTMRLRRDILAGLDQEAQAKGLSRTAMLEQIVAKYLCGKGHKLGVRVTV